MHYDSGSYCVFYHRFPDSTRLGLRIILNLLQYLYRIKKDRARFLCMEGNAHGPHHLPSAAHHAL